MVSRTIIIQMVFLALLSVGLWRYSDIEQRRDGTGWGVDACLTTHVNGVARAKYLKQISETGVGWLRERQLKASMRSVRRSGYRVVAFMSFGLHAKQPGNQLAEDLREVFVASRNAQQNSRGMVDAWEMVGEPDLGFATDLPDRVAAYQKALYLGLKAGGEARLSDGGYSLAGPKINNSQRSTSNSSAPIVLMGALGLPPGPWLERAAANGLLEYTDAYNFHFYGHAADLTGVIEAHRAAIAALSAKREAGSVVADDGRQTAEGGRLKSAASNNPQVSGFRSQVSAPAKLPLWITEAGIEAVPRDDYLHPQRRQLQADFTISTAKQALAAPDVAMFMPFILVHDKDPYAMTVSPTQTFPAWDEYAKFTRENPWPKRPLARKPHEASPIVVQWMPDNQTTVPHKVGGTYRFRDERTPIKGELRVYNFGGQGVTGHLEADELKVGRVILNAPRHSNHGGLGTSRPTDDRITIPPMGMVAVPVEFVPTAAGYFRETFRARFVEVGRVVPNAPKDDGGLGTSRPTFESTVSFGLAARARIEDFTEEPLALRALPDGKIRFPQIEPYVSGEQVWVWTTINGLHGEVPRKLDVKGDRLEGQTTSNIEHLTSNFAAASAATFWVEAPNTDPLAPTMAVAAVDGLRVAAPGELSDGSSPLSGNTNNRQPITNNTQTFLRLQLDKPMTKARKVLVVLVDDRGQRYSIWENYGVDYYGSRSDVWLNLEDFHADFWGPMSADYQFRPERIREVHLRLYLDNPNDKVSVGLSLLRAKR